jgi:hypothetical protein
MNTPQSPICHEIRVHGQLGQAAHTWFPDMTIRHESGDTILCGPITDQAALHGILMRIRDLGLPLVSVRQIETEDCGADGPGKRQE